MEPMTVPSVSSMARLRPAPRKSTSRCGRLRDASHCVPSADCKDVPVALQQSQRLPRRVTFQPGLAPPQGLFRGGAFQMPRQNGGIIGIDDGQFRRTRKEIVGMPQKILIQRVVPGHQNNGGFSQGPSHAAAALQRRRDRARIAHQNADVQTADIYAQFQRAGGNDGQQFAGGHARFDLAAFLRQETGPVGGNAPGKGPFHGSGPQAHKLRHPPGAAIHNGTQAARHGRLEQINGRACRTLRRFKKNIMPRAPGRPGAIHDHGSAPALLVRSRRGQTRQRRRQLAGIAHGGRTENKGRIGAVAGRKTGKATEHPRHVRPENAPIDMRFVNDNVGKARQKGGPLLMMGQNAQMQHFRIADQHGGRPEPNLAPGIVRRIAVIQRNGGARLFRPCLHQRPERSHLILRQRLEGKEIQRPGIGIAQKFRQHRQGIDQALAAGRGRRHNNAAAAPNKVRRFGLMPVQGRASPLKTPRAQGFFHSLRPRQATTAVFRLPRRQAAMVADLSAQTLRSQQRPHIFSNVSLP